MKQQTRGLPRRSLRRRRFAKTSKDTKTISTRDLRRLRGLRVCRFGAGSHRRATRGGERRPHGPPWPGIRPRAGGGRASRDLRRAGAGRRGGTQGAGRRIPGARDRDSHLRARQCRPPRARRLRRLRQHPLPGPADSECADARRGARDCRPDPHLEGRTCGGVLLRIVRRVLRDARSSSGLAPITPTCARPRTTCTTRTCRGHSS